MMNEDLDFDFLTIAFASWVALSSVIIFMLQLPNDKDEYVSDWVVLLNSKTHFKHALVLNSAMLLFCLSIDFTLYKEWVAENVAIYLGITGLTVSILSIGTVLWLRVSLSLFPDKLVEEDIKATIGKLEAESDFYKRVIYLELILTKFKLRNKNPEDISYYRFGNLIKIRNGLVNKSDKDFRDITRYFNQKLVEIYRSLICSKPPVKDTLRLIESQCLRTKDNSAFMFYLKLQFLLAWENNPKHKKQGLDNYYQLRKSVENFILLYLIDSKISKQELVPYLVYLADFISNIQVLQDREYYLNLITHIEEKYDHKDKNQFPVSKEDFRNLFFYSLFYVFLFRKKDINCVFKAYLNNYKQANQYLIAAINKKPGPAWLSLKLLQSNRVDGKSEIERLVDTTIRSLYMEIMPDEDKSNLTRGIKTYSVLDYHTESMNLISYLWWKELKKIVRSFTRMVNLLVKFWVNLTNQV